MSGNRSSFVRMDGVRFSRMAMIASPGFNWTHFRFNATANGFRG